MTVSLSFCATESSLLVTLQIQDHFLREWINLTKPQNSLSSVLAPTIDALWKEADYAPLDWLVVPRGPVPFTTLRILLATAQGLVLGSSSSLNIFSPTNFDLMAYAAYHEHYRSQPLLLLLHSKRHELYGQLWKDGKPAEKAGLWSPEQIESYKKDFPDVICVGDASASDHAYKVYDSATAWSDLLLYYLWEERLPLGPPLSEDETSLKPYYVYDPVYATKVC
jgi:tRNA A37 threonylcarbamoyladenosine modification protein TsaB